MTKPTPRVGDFAMKHEAFLDKEDSYCWRVEAFNFHGDGECYITKFYGPLAEQRANRYADWMNGND